MPELPEVETVRRGLAIIAPPGSRITQVVLRRPDLRFPFPPTLSERLTNRVIRGYRRHGKYLLWDLDDVVVLSHLGMSGTWRASVDGDHPRQHDHVDIELADGARLTYHDPRRFGFIDLIEPHGESTHPRMRDLGPDALDVAAFTTEHVADALRGRTAPIKSMLLDQRVVAGVGNIYACEALFRAKIRPQVAAGRLRRPRIHSLVEAVREILHEAISSGGSTLKDFRQAGGETGYFQHRFAVYGRDGQPCMVCGKTLMGGVIGGRATVWCRYCQNG